MQGYAKQVVQGIAGDVLEAWPRSTVRSFLAEAYYRRAHRELAGSGFECSSSVGGIEGGSTQGPRAWFSINKGHDKSKCLVI